MTGCFKAHVLSRAAATAAVLCLLSGIAAVYGAETGRTDRITELEQQLQQLQQQVDELKQRKEERPGEETAGVEEPGILDSPALQTMLAEDSWLRRFTLGGVW